MGLSIPQMATMSRLLDEALPLDAGARRVWLEALAPEHQDLAQALRQALLPQDFDQGDFKALGTLPKFDSADQAGVVSECGLQAGARVGPYELIRALGAGGMAEVWLARRADGAFKREVALKLPMRSRLRKDLEQRFARERDILASLEHPHIARLYDAGTEPGGLSYLSMEYVQGQALTDWGDAQRLSIASRLELFRQVLDAVQYAHEKQVVHRDLKPSNILVTESGQVRLLDFGVAKLLEGEEADQTQLTSVFGRALTPDYASPELLRGDAVDARTDIYSLGVLLYEMLTGARPYRLKRAASFGLIEQAIATQEVRKPSTQLEAEAIAARGTTREKLARQLRGDLDAIVLKALAKEPAERYPSAGALAEDLRRHLEGEPIGALPGRFSYRLRKFVLRNKTTLGFAALAAMAILASVGYSLHREQAMRASNSVKVSAAAAGATARINPGSAAFSPPAHSVAVLPFANLSADVKQEYFSDGLSEELINALSHIGALEVVARTSSFSFKGQNVDIGTIARRLNVAAILEGSVRRSNNKVRITAQLINAVNGFSIWSQDYDRDLNNILAEQTDIAKAVARQLQVQLLGDEAARIERGGTHQTEAHDAYLRGLHALNLRTKEASSQSIAEFSRATVIDPDYALAWAALARAYSLAQIFGGGTAAQTMPKARSAALRALQLDDSLGDAHATLAFVQVHYDYDWAGAQREFRRALQLDPNSAQAHFFYSNSWLSPRGRHDEAIAEMRVAAKLDPLSVGIQAFVGRTYTWARRYDEALAAFQHAEQLNPNVAIVQERLAHLYTYTAEYPKAIAAETRARVLSGEAVETTLGKERELRAALAKDGPPGYWRVVLSFSQSADNPPEAYSTNYGRAVVFARLGESEQALAALEQAYAERQLALTEMGVEPAFDALRSHPHFSELLRRVGLAQAGARLAPG